MNQSPIVLSEALAALGTAQPDTSMTAAPPAAPQGGADMMGGSVTPGDAATPGTVAPGTTPGTGQAQRPPGLFDGPMGMITLFMIGMLVFMLFTSARRQKREAAKRAELINSLRKGDKVQTIAGIRGTIDENPDGKDEVVLVVDPVTRNRIRFAKSAITQVDRDGAGASTVEAKAETQPAGV
jgi:preprotein translocase subunit YajC